MKMAINGRRPGGRPAAALTEIKLTTINERGKTKPSNHFKRIQNKEKMFMALSKKQQEAVNFLHTMEKDLQRAERSYYDGDYPNSLYFLQMAVEKGIKAQSLFFDIIESGQLLQISHTPTEAYKIAVEKMDRQSDNLKEFYKDDPLRHEFIITTVDFSELKQGTDSCVQTLNAIKKNKERFKNMKKVNLKKFQNIMEKKQNQITILREKIENEQLSQSDYPTIKTDIYEILDSNSMFNSSIRKKESNLLDLFIVTLSPYLSFNQVIFCFLDLFGSIILLAPLAIISQPHHESTQYPTSKSSPEEKYSAHSNPLIRDLPFFIQKGKVSMKYLTELFEFSTLVEQKKQ